MRPNFEPRKIELCYKIKVVEEFFSKNKTKDCFSIRIYY